MPGIAVALSGRLLLFAAIGLGMRQYESAIPLVVTSSTAISASAHNEFDLPVGMTKPMIAAMKSSCQSLVLVLLISKVLPQGVECIYE
jgi:hypothetical protein